MTFIRYLYLGVNIIALILYGIDKLKAIKNLYRLSEKTLLLASLLGPFGAFFGMLVFRHKIRKIHFKLLLVIFVIIHIGIYLWISNENILL